MANNDLKNPFWRSLPNAIQSKILDAVQLTGKALPCHVIEANGAIITVAFDVSSIYTLPQVSIPLFGPIYIRYPIQKGDLGVVIPMDARIGYTSGQGGGISDLSQPANLSALVFLPIGNMQWSEVDPNAVTIYGPNGVVLRDTSSATTFVLTPTSITVITPESYTVTTEDTVLQLTPAGWSLIGTNGNMQDGTAHTSPAIMNSAWNTLVAWLNTHDHTNGNGGANTGTPVTPFTGGNIAPT